MSKTQLLRRRALQLVLIAAWLALGTVMVVVQPNWWVWFAAVSYLIALFYIVAEVLTWRHALRARGGAAEKKDQAPPTPE
jgi:hypothetical protein